MIFGCSRRSPLLSSAFSRPASSPPRGGGQPLPRREPAAEVRRLTCAPAEWVARVRLDPEGRWYEQIRVDDALELWLISWLPGQSTGFHDHGGANGAFGVVWGELDEYVAERRAVASAPNPVPAGKVRSFGPRHVHDVRNS